MRHRAGQYALKVSSLLDLERDRGDIGGGGAAGGNHEFRRGEVVPGLECGVGVLEAGGEDGVKMARGEIAEGITKVGRRGSLNRCDRRAQPRMDEYQSA